MSLSIALLNLWKFLLAIFSISYFIRGNVFFTATMQLIISVMAAQFCIVSVGNLRSTIIVPVMADGAYIKLIYLAVAFLMASTFFSKWRWLSRYPTAILAGTGLGLVLRSILFTDVLGQITGSFMPLTGNLTADLSTVIFVVVLFLSLFYFAFSYELKGPWVKINRYSRLLIMAAMGGSIGASFYGNTALRLADFYMLKAYVEEFFINLLG